MQAHEQPWIFYAFYELTFLFILFLVLYNSYPPEVVQTTPWTAFFVPFLLFQLFSSRSLPCLDSLVSSISPSPLPPFRFIFAHRPLLAHLGRTGISVVCQHRDHRPICSTSHRHHIPTMTSCSLHPPRFVLLQTRSCSWCHSFLLMGVHPVYSYMLRRICTPFAILFAFSCSLRGS